MRLETRPTTPTTRPTTEPDVPPVIGTRACRGCGAPLERIFVDLGPAPPCEDWLTADRLLEPEVFYPQDVRICDACLLVQLPTYISAEDIFREYGYFSSYSDSWVEHAARFVDEAVQRQRLGSGSLVIEVASNDGYLLQHVIPRGIPALGIEPARNIAAAARKKGIPTISEFLTRDLARQIVAEKGHADLVVANNVWAHVPDLNDFTAGLATLMSPTGLLSIEVAYLARLIEDNEFDTIYHEHFMYYSVLSAESVLQRHGLRIQDVEELPTHGGSIRLWVVRRRRSASLDGSRRRRSRPASGPPASGRSPATKGSPRRPRPPSWTSSSSSSPNARPATGSSATARPARATRS